MDEKEIELCGFTFVANFDSANLSRVEFVPRKPVEPTVKSTSKKQASGSRFMQKRLKTSPIEFPDYEFNVWTNPDCSGTEFENTNRTWFYFGVRGGTPFSLVKLNIVDLNKQSKMYSQGMAPVFKVSPGRSQWERIHDKPVFTSENNVFTLSFKFRALENIKATTYFAFTYPFSYTELQNYLSNVDAAMSKPENHLPKTEIRFNKGLKINNDINDAIYYHRETLCYSLEYRNVDLITISSHHNITAEREPRIDKLFPDENNMRPFKFQDKKVVFISARVHPGETPSSFVFNGLLNLLTQKDDPIGILLRRQYVFKLIPMLNPDGVARGHYRTDTRGCNLNRFYLNPSSELHPSIYAARALIRYYHYGKEVTDDQCRKVFANESNQVEMDHSPVPDTANSPSELDSLGGSSVDVSTDANMKDFSDSSESEKVFVSANASLVETVTKSNKVLMYNELNRKSKTAASPRKKENVTCKLRSSHENNRPESGLFLYVDMHGHASKKGIFMYGNHFDKVEDGVECMLLPKIMSVNSQNFHFPACNFTEKNMYLRDKRDGTSREGSGRVAVLRITGLVRSYTLECNYNTGRFVNTLPQCARDLPGKISTNLIAPPKYSPAVFEEIGRSLGVSILDLTNSNPWSRIPNSEYHTVFGIRDWLRLKILSESFLYQRGAPRPSLRSKSNCKSSQTQEKFSSEVKDASVQASFCDLLTERNSYEVDEKSSEFNLKSPRDRARELLNRSNFLKECLRGVDDDLTVEERKMMIKSELKNALNSLENSLDDSCKVIMGVLASERKFLRNVRLTPLRCKQEIGEENIPEDYERKENLTTFQGTSKAPGILGRRQPGTSRRSMNRVGNVLQVHRASASRSLRPLTGSSKKSGYLASGTEKVSKFKQFSHKSDLTAEDQEAEGRLTIAKVSIELNCDRGKMPSVSDSCIFKQGPKRLKISKMEGDGGKLKVSDWAKEDAVPGTSSEMIVYSRISRPLTHLSNTSEGYGLGKKRVLKTRSQISPMKYKKSLEMRRGNEGNRRKMKNLFKKSGKK